MGHWSRFYPLPEDLGHTKLEGRKKKEQKGQVQCVYVCAPVNTWACVFQQMLLNSSALLLYCPTNDTCGLVYFLQSPDVHRLLRLEVEGVPPIAFAPVMLILADHLEVPSSTLCLICFICVT